MKLLQGTIFCLLLSSISSETPTANTPLSTTSKVTTISPTINTTTSPNDEKSTGEISTEGTSTKNIMETKLSTTEATVMSQSLSSAVSTSQSSDSKINTSPPEASSFRTTTLSSISVTTPENISPSQGFILPMVIALIVITLSVFVLVGLYRMCWKTDPGTQENGNEQPQSDKESVKLLTVKTISHESGEHSAQGKTKN
ncbi:endomucin isoform X4 [Capricornis sumatraensis]|uniref:endomucin isoform X4 n=1 Tax=Capricornis sumatraensis TaxID=34865 RepID=UPI003604EE66